MMVLPHLQHSTVRIDASPSLVSDGVLCQVVSNLRSLSMFIILHPSTTSISVSSSVFCSVTCSVCLPTFLFLYTMPVSIVPFILAVL